MYKFCSFLHNITVEAYNSLKQDAVKKLEKGEQKSEERSKGQKLSFC